MYPSSSASIPPHTLRDVQHSLILANHILHKHGLVDAYGHVSARHPTNTSLFIMSGEMAPALVESPSDFVEYYLFDSSPVDPTAPEGYRERYIHGEIYKRFPEVQCVVHSHAQDVLPYTTSGVPLIGVIHMSGFLGSSVPVFDIGPLYNEGDRQDLLITNTYFGAALAECFSAPNMARSPGPFPTINPPPNPSVVLMRRHGFTTHGTSIAQAVYRAVYTAVNARAQTQSILLRNAFASRPSGIKFTNDPNPLTADMARGCEEVNGLTVERPWRLWCREVERDPLYSVKMD